MPQVLSLYDLNQLVRSVIYTAFPGTVLVTAEIASCDVKNHCYLSLVDKEEDSIRAEIKAVIWASRYRTVAQAFRKATGVELAKGLKVLLEANVDFHERYGLKLIVQDIDPSYTIGELAVRRKEILERLAKEGLKERNRELEFPLVPQRVGIISSATAAGYEDLLNHLTHNPYGYVFACRLYEAVMQGDRAEASIVKALQGCSADSTSLDVVVIVRGGGGQTDLHCFDSYEIAKAIALLPLPVISGIGHERDITVADEVSNMRAKTPTAVADLIITRVKRFEDSIDSLANTLVHGTRRLSVDEKDRVSSLAGSLGAYARKVILDSEHGLVLFLKGVKYSLKYLRSEAERLRSREHNVNHLDPVNVLKRGYSITYGNGKALRSGSEAEKGDTVRTVLHQGELISRVESIKKVRKT